MHLTIHCAKKKKKKENFTVHTSCELSVKGNHETLRF
jgi:hypothetical protein